MKNLAGSFEVSQNRVIKVIKEGKWISLPPIMTIESLLDYGFKEWPKSQHDKHDRHWQFCKLDEKGKKIYVIVRLWEFSKYSTPDREVADSFDAEVQFDMNGPKTFNVNMNDVDDMTPSQVVDWFERMHNLMGCTHCELYDEREDETTHNCNKCGKFLSPEESFDPFLCPPCKYEHDSGFLKPVIKKKKNKK